MNNYSELIKGCIKCPKPLCSENCPLHNRVPEIIKALEAGKEEEAVELLYSKSPFPLITGLFCNGYCYQNCVLNRANRPFNFQAVENTLAHLPHTTKIEDEILKDKKVAIIGAGPVGIALALLLKRSDATVDIFEKDNDYLQTVKKIFPETKVKKEEIDAIDSFLKGEHLHFILNTSVGRDVMLDDLRKEYDYVVIAAGHNISKTCETAGDNNYYYAYDFLENLKKPEYLDNFGDNFLIYGLGNVAIDLAVYLTHKGKNVRLVYHKPREKSRLSPHDIKKIDIYHLDVTFDTRVIKVENNTVTLEHNSETYEIKDQTAIFAIGQKSDNLFLNNSVVKIEDLTYDQNSESAIKNLYLAGDFSSTRWDISTGIETAWNIYNHLKEINQ